MRGRNQISWNDKQTKELKQQVKRFNAKITREIKRSPELADFLPQKLSVRTERQKIKTASDLKLFSARVDRAFAKGAFTPVVTGQGIATTKYELKELSLGVRRINRERKKELERAAPSTKKGTMGTIRQNNLIPKRFNPNEITRQNWKAFVESVERQSMPSYTEGKMLTYKENYIRALENIFGPDADEVIGIVRALPPSKVYQAFYDNPNLQLGFIYDPLDAAVILEEITEDWKGLIETEG